MFNFASDLYIDIYHILDSSERVAKEELKTNEELYFVQLKEKIDEIVNIYNKSFTSESLKRDKTPSKLANYLNGIEEKDGEITNLELEKLKDTSVTKETEY